MLLQENETEIQELKILLNRQKHEQRQQWKAQEHEVQLSNTLQRNNTPLLQAHLRTNTIQAEIPEGHRKSEHLQTAVEEFQCVNDQFSPTNVDTDAELHNCKSKNVQHLQFQEKIAKLQSTVADLTEKNYKNCSQVAKVQESIINIKTAIDEIKEENSKLHSMISELHLQMNSITMDPQGNVQPADESVRDKLCEKAGTEDEELHLRILNLYEQNNQLKTMIIDLDKKQSCQGTLHSQIQEHIDQFQAVAEKLQQGNKKVQTIISELYEKKCQFEDLASGLQRNIAKLQAAIPHNVQPGAFSELRHMTENYLNLRHENWKLQDKMSELCKSKSWLESSLSTLNAKVFQLEASKFDSQKLQHKIFDLQDKSNEYTNAIIKLEGENINLQKNYCGLQSYKNKLLTIISELQSKALMLEGADLQNKRLQCLAQELLGKNAELNVKIIVLAERNNSLEEYLLQVQQNINHRQKTAVELHGYTRPQTTIAEVSGNKYQFETELQTVIDILAITAAIKEKLQVTISEQQEHILESQGNILKLQRRITSLHQLVTELQNISHQFSLNVLELQDNIYMSGIREAQNQCSPVICQDKKHYHEGMVSISQLETVLESPFARLTASTESSLIHIILKIIKISKDIVVSIEKIGIETRHLQVSIFDLELKMQLHKDGLLNSEVDTLQEIVQQLKEHKYSLENHEYEKALLQQKISEIDKILVNETSFTNEIEAQIKDQQHTANSENKKLQKLIIDLLSNNLELENTINWTLERNEVLDVQLAALKNILREEQVQFNEKEVKLNWQWKIYIKHIEHLQGVLSEMVAENTNLKETVEILVQEKVHLQTTVSELQSNLKSGKLNTKSQQDDHLHAESSNSRLCKKSKTVQKNNIKLTRSLKEFEGVPDLPANTRNKLKPKLTEENLSFDEEVRQIEEKAINNDGKDCLEALLEELMDESDKDCEVHIAIEKAETTTDLVNLEINIPLTDKVLFHLGSERSDISNPSTLDVSENFQMQKMPNELMEYNKELTAYIETLMEEKYWLTVAVCELKLNLTELQQQVDKSESQMINNFCKYIPIFIDPVENENTRLFDHENALVNIVNELGKNASLDEFDCSRPAVQMEIEKEKSDAENNQLQNKVKDLQKKNEELEMSIKKHEHEKKLLETNLIKKENYLSLEQKNACEMQSLMKYEIQIIEKQKCQLETMADDLLDGNMTLSVDVDKMLLQLTEDEMDSDLKMQHYFNEHEAKISEPEEVCETIEVQDEAKTLDETRRQHKLIEKYKVEKESLLKFKILLRNQQMYCRTSANLTNDLKEVDEKIGRLQEKLNALTCNSSKFLEILNQSTERSQISNICSSESQVSKSVSMEPVHLCNLINPDFSGKHADIYPDSGKDLESYIQLSKEKNKSKILNVQNVQHLESIKESQNSNESIQKAMEKTDRDKKLLELNVTHHKGRIDAEQHACNNLTVYLKNKSKILGNQNNNFHDMIAELLNDISRFQVSIDNLEQAKKLLKIKITELNDGMKIDEACCSYRVKQGSSSQAADPPKKLTGSENTMMNFLAALYEVDKDTILPAVMNHVLETGDELQNSETRSQQTIDNTENGRIMFVKTTGNLQDKILEEHNFSIALLELSQTMDPSSANSYQRKVVKNPPESHYSQNESLVDKKVKLIDSEPTEEHLTSTKIHFQPANEEDLKWTMQETELVDMALGSIAGEISLGPISENQLSIYKTKRNNTESETINKLIINFQDINQQAKEKNIFSTCAHLSVADEDYNLKTNCKCDFNQNCTESEVRNTWLQETFESTNSMGYPEIGNIMRGQDTLLAGDSKQQYTGIEKIADTVRTTSVCAIESPIIYIKGTCQQEKAVPLSKRVQERNRVTLNHQEDKELVKPTLDHQETELWEEELTDNGYIDQSLSIKPMAVSTEFMEPTSSGTEQITETSEVQKDNKNVKAAITDLVVKIKPTLIEEDINSLNSLTSEEITGHELIEKENNKSTPSLWMRCMIQ
ncbi:kinesin-related protein 4-like [Amblyraja radiata]|uniref:kinesin-related protein 4-like n=1 Tax=Amblyraja radiata TaxID=386614 RepID=UPI0014031D38|nr:kinesin-related protein 4-like [Amblyraja radiata]